ncbi:MAG TPA: T9SS type A sorting domain-containing protein [Bacteroidia bacterium]|nr:T9SS type A sorting domain-containing protein [Bacteroidia bacterium]
MKKLLLGAIFVLGSILSMNAQTTILAQPFGTSSIPSGWAENTPAVAADNWKFSNAFGTNMASYVPNQGYCTFVDDWDNNPAQTTPNWDTLKSPSMNCSAYSKVYISLNYMFWMDDGNETGTLAISTNGGATWTKAINFPNTNGGWVNGAIYDISAWAAGHANVMVAFTYYDGFKTTTNGYVAVGMAIQKVTIYSPVNYNVQVETQNTSYFLQVGTAYPFSGSMYNNGGEDIVSLDMNYSVNGGPVQTQNISGITGFRGLSSYNWSMNSLPFTPTATGPYTVKYWVSNLNGNNANTNTDTLVASFMAITDVVAKQSLYEEQTGQSCVFCMLAAPNMDTVYNNNATTSNIVRYHVPIPARDFMYEANTTPVIQKENYYAITGAPWGDLDGTYLNPSAYQNPPENTIYSSVTLQAENKIGSPFKIDITKSYYNAAKDSFYVSANITSYASFSAGLTAQVALTIDSTTYKYDLSMDDPQQSFAAPVGTGASGFSYTNCPDYFYDYVLKFTHVCEEMFPNSGNGTSLAAFTPNSTQTVSFGWKKNHPWGLYDVGLQRDSDFYDSSATAQFVVFVQTNNAISTNIPAKYVFQSASAPVNEVTGIAATITASKNVSCNGNNSGSATVTAIGGTAPYTYSWSPSGQTNATATGLSAGTYTATVTDAVSEIVTAIVTITEPAPLAATTPASWICISSPMGTATETPTGGTTPYQYAWAPGGQTNATATGLSLGTYTVTVTDSCGANSTASVTIVHPIALRDSIATSVNILCNGSDEGTATVGVKGGTAPYTYAWTPSGQTTATAMGLSAGSYTVTVSDNCGDTPVTANVTLTEPTAMTITTYSTIDNGTCNGLAAVTVSGGTAPYTYLWNDLANLKTDSIKLLCWGSYCCDVTDNNKCTQTVCVTVASTLGIDDISNASATINIYPNPSKGQFTIVGLKKGMMIEVYDFTGRLVSNIAAYDVMINCNLSNQANGLYFVRIISQDGALISQQKIVKVQ